MIEFITGDAVESMDQMPENKFDLVFGSPPYCDARDYGISAQRDCLEWVEWMLKVSESASRVCKGPVLWVAAGVTRNRNYWPACEGLLWEWWKKGGAHHLYRPCYWHRHGICGSGGDQWFRADIEYVMCLKKPGKLPWSDNTACGNLCKYPVGGEMSYRHADGQRRNAKTGRRLGNKVESFMANGPRVREERSHTKRHSDGSMRTQIYTPPEIANPGNLIHTTTGGGNLGSDLAHENEAPFSEKLAEFFVYSLCPPNGSVLDPFSGSGTTMSVCRKSGRDGVGIDIRESQTELGKRRTAQIQRSLLP